MRRILAVVMLMAAAAGAAEEAREVDGRIERISLFKNGLCVVHRMVELPGSGEFVLKQQIQPVHGTYFVASRLPVRSRVEQRLTAVPAEALERISPTRDLAGQKVRILLRDLPDAPVKGRVLGEPKSFNHPEWDRRYKQRRWSWWSSAPVRSTNEPSDPDYLVLATEDGGRVFVDPSQIALLRTEAPAAPIMRRRARLVLSVDEKVEADDKPVLVRISYLTKGLAWAPSYRVDLSDTDSLALHQSAVLRNELEDLHETPVELVSGFPNMVFSHVLSPLAADVTWSQFFQQLSQDYEPGHAATSNIMTQVVRSPSTGGVRGGVDASAGVAGERGDLHYQPIGPISLKEGEALHLTIAAGEAVCERIVEWDIPDNRDENGRRRRDRDRWTRAETAESQAWDAVRFDNPLTSPMTTAPATLFADGRFLGQSLSTWVNPGQRTSLKITKTLSVVTRFAERERSLDRNRQIIHLGSRNYAKVPVEGKLEMTNLRRRPATMVIHRRFSGELDSADGEPTRNMLETGAYSVNPRNELTWEVELEPGASKVLTYQYTVLVWR